ncbi:MAG: helix-turn-helix domain-containing protein [Actinobacteria bacterium]|nr:helix-turn-helix domain-containing protein [Actinomycetota bacterium]
MTAPTDSGVRSWAVADLPPGDRLEGWAEAISATHLSWALDGRGGTLLPDAVVTRRMLGPVALVDCVAGAGAGGRTARHAAATDGEYVGVLVVRDGVEHLEIDGEAFVARAGDVVVWDSRVPTRFRIPERLVKRTLLVPRGRLPQVAERAGRACARGLLPRTAATALLVDYLAAVVGRCAADDPLPPAAAHAAGSAAVDLLAAVLDDDAPGADRPAWHDAAWRTARAYVEEHLHDPALDPRAVAAAACLSLRALYVLFERHGETVVGHVRRRRLERAHADLLRLGPRTTVAAVAARWGFADAGTFTRAYRRAYGVPPSHTLRAG